MSQAAARALRHGSPSYVKWLRPFCNFYILSNRPSWTIRPVRRQRSHGLRTLAALGSRRVGTSDKSATPSEPRICYTEVDEHGGVKHSVTCTRSQLLAKYGLAPRDIRKIDSSTLSHILIRPSTVLLHLFHLKVLVQRNRVLIFDSFQSTATAPPITTTPARSALLRDLQERIGELSSDVPSHSSDASGPAPLPYEFKALEAVFGAVVTELEREFDAIREPAVQLLRSLEEEVDSSLDRRKLHVLLNLHNRLSRFAQQAELVRTAVEDVLDYDTSMAALYLTDKAEGRARATFDDLTSVELLLDSYYRLFDEILQEAQNLVSAIRNTEESVSAILDANRNLLMLLDLKFRMGTLGLAMGSFFSAFYGMNIMNHIRDYFWAFPGVCGTSFVLSIAVGGYGMLVLRKFVRLRIEGRGATATTNRRVSRAR